MRHAEERTKNDHFCGRREKSKERLFFENLTEITMTKIEAGKGSKR